MLRGVAACGLLVIWLAQHGAAFAQEPSLAVRLSADMPATSAQRLVSALEAQLADLTTIDLGEPSAEHALGIVSIAQSATTLSVQFADAQAQPIGAPRVVSGAGELSASEVASIVRAFVIARLEHERVRAEQAATSAPQATAAPQASAAAAQTPEQATARQQPRSATPASQTAQANTNPVQQKPQAAATARQKPQTAVQPARATATLLAKPPAPVEQDGDTLGTAATPALAARPDVAVDPPAAGTSESWRLRLAALYTGATYAPQLQWHDGLRVDASTRLKSMFYLGASYGYQLPADVSNQAAPVRVAAHVVYAFFGLGRTWRSVGAALDLGLGALRTLRSTGQVAETLEKTPDDAYWNMLAALRLHGRLRFPALPRLALDVAPALELAPGARGAVARLDNGGESDVLSPGLVRARIDVGASFDVF